MKKQEVCYFLRSVRGGGIKMGSLLEIHRSNSEWLKSYVCPDGFKLDSVRYQIGASFEMRHEHFDTFRAHAHAMEIMTGDDAGHLLLAEDMDAINAGYYCKFEREADGTVSLYSRTPGFCEKVPFSNICDYFRKPVYRRSSHV